MFCLMKKRLQGECRWVFSDGSGNGVLLCATKCKWQGLEVRQEVCSMARPRTVGRYYAHHNAQQG